MDHPQATIQYMENVEKTSTMMKLLSTILMPSAHNMSYFAKNKLSNFLKACYIIVAVDCTSLS